MAFRKLCVLFVLILICSNCKENVALVETSSIIPLPRVIQGQAGYFILNKTVGISDSDEFPQSVTFLKSFLQNANYKLSSGQDIIFKKDEALADEAYRLEVGSNQISISAKSDIGAFYAIQSLRQKLPADLQTISFIR